MLQTTSVVLAFSSSVTGDVSTRKHLEVVGLCVLHIREQFINVHKNGATGGKGFCTTFILH